MYINEIELDHIRVFENTTIQFVHPDLKYSTARSDPDGDWANWPKPKLKNVTVLFGDNAAGKSTVLQAIALSALGPAAEHTKLSPRHLVRFHQGEEIHPSDGVGTIASHFTMHDQDGVANQTIVESCQEYATLGELERIHWTDPGTIGPSPGYVWGPVYESNNPSFFVVGYGATRRVEPGESLDTGARTKSSFSRGQRIQGLFQDSFSLIPLTYWLPNLKTENKDRYEQVIDLIDKLAKPGKFKFTGEMKEGDYLFENKGLKVPFRSLSDGYRGFIGWVGDMLYHICFGCPNGKKLIDSHGIVLVDEIDLHLHPTWQMKVIATIAKALPNMQFIFTSHSPLVAGSLEWMNVVLLKARGTKSTATRVEKSLHGLDADQVLLTDFFGMSTTRAKAKSRQLTTLSRAARSGDDDAARELIEQLSKGMELER